MRTMSDAGIPAWVQEMWPKHHLPHTLHVIMVVAAFAVHQQHDQYGIGSGDTAIAPER